jgi:hypothetical protein
MMMASAWKASVQAETARTTTPALFDESLKARKRKDLVGLLSLSLSSTTLRFLLFVLRGSVRAQEFVCVQESESVVLSPMYYD